MGEGSRPPLRREGCPAPAPAWKRGFSLTSEQLEASRAERMRQNGLGTLTLEDARTWIEETGLCLFLPRRQFSSSVAPSFVEAIAGQRDATPDPEAYCGWPKSCWCAWRSDGVAVRLNLLGQPGEQPDFVVASLGSALRVCSARRPRLAPQPATDRLAPGFAVGRSGLQAARSGRRHHLPS